MFRDVTINNCRIKNINTPLMTDAIKIATPNHRTCFQNMPYKTVELDTGNSIEIAMALSIPKRTKTGT